MAPSQNASSSEPSSPNGERLGPSRSSRCGSLPVAERGGEDHRPVERRARPGSRRGPSRSTIRYLPKATASPRAIGRSRRRREGARHCLPRKTPFAPSGRRTSPPASQTSSRWLREISHSGSAIAQSEAGSRPIRVIPSPKHMGRDRLDRIRSVEEPQQEHQALLPDASVRERHAGPMRVASSETGALAPVSPASASSDSASPL